MRGQMSITNSGLGTGIFPVAATSVFERPVVGREGLNVDPVASMATSVRSQLPGMNEVGYWLRRNQGTVLLAIGGVALLVMMRK